MVGVITLKKQVFLLLIFYVLLSSTIAQSQIIISEFMASNSNSIQDEDGNYSDWIELFNTSNATVDLSGWSLTDNPLDLTKWQFPAITIPAGDYLVVFASGKNQIAGELHTNFQLDSSGEYLALVRPDGTTIEQEFAPTFPKQKKNLSYGIEQTLQPLVIEGDAARYHVPTIADSGVNFTPSIFDDSTWATGPTALHFNSLPADIISNWTFDTNANDSVGTNNGGLQGGATINGDSQVGAGSVSLNGSSGYVSLGNPASLQIAGQITIATWIKPGATDGLRNIVSKGYQTGPNGEIALRISSGVYEVGSWNGTGFYVSGGNAATDVGQWVHLAGTYDGANWRLYRNGVLLNNLSSAVGAFNFGADWAIGARGTGTERFFSGLVDDVYISDRAFSQVEISQLMVGGQQGGTDISSAMLGVNSSVWARMNFNVANPAIYDSVYLGMRFEDGFEAFLNGTSIASENAPASLNWNSAAVIDRGFNLSNSFEFFGAANLLQAGSNTLAIHALNDTAAEAQFLVLPELYAVSNGSTPKFFADPTPGTPNGTGYDGFVADTKFDVDRGFYDTPFTLNITTETTGATIRYTTDGSDPTSTTGIPSGSVSISDTTPVRAAAFFPGYIPSNIDTHTYIFLDNVIASAVMDTGITQHGVYGPLMRQALTDLPTISIVDPSFRLEQTVVNGPYPAGTYDEYPVSFEYLTSDGSVMLQEDAGSGRYGGHFYDRPGWTYPFEKWSYRIYFRKEYGAGMLKAPLFEGFDNGIPTADTFDHLEIRSGSHDMFQRGFYMSGALTADTMLGMGNINPHSRFVHVYINGTYWGQYNLHERWNAAMVAEYAGGEKEDYEAVKANNNGGNFGPVEPYDGDGTVWANALTLRNSYVDLKTWVDMQSYIDFMLMFMFGNSESEFRAVGANTEAGIGFLFWLRDPDGFTRTVGDRTNNPGPGDIFSSLVAEGHPDFMILLADRIHKHLFNDGQLTEATMNEKLLKRCNEVEIAFYAEAARWGYLSPSAWDTKKNDYINNVLSTKPQQLLNDLRNRGLYPNTDAPVFSQQGGDVTSGFNLVVTDPNAPNQTIYYTTDGSDPREATTGNPVGIVIANGGSITINQSMQVNARVRSSGGVWSALNCALFIVPTAVDVGDLVISELHYDPKQPTAAELLIDPLFENSDFEFIELFNNSGGTLDLTGVEISNGVTFSFTSGTILSDGAYILIVKDVSAFEARYGTGLNIAGEFSEKLSNGGERVEVQNANAVSFIDFTYADNRGWHLAADGGGHSLVPVDSVITTTTAGLLDFGGNWRSSSYIDGSPGIADPAKPASIVINEIAAHTDHTPSPPDSNDWVELYNPNGSSVVLNDYWLSDDKNDLQKWMIPNGTNISDDGFLDFDEITGFNNPTGSGFGLNKSGEQIILSHLPSAGAQRIVDAVRFKGQDNEAIATLGRFADGDLYFQPMPATRGASNQTPPQGLYIEQVMYHPADELDSSEYIRISNPTASPILMENPAVTVGTAQWRITGEVEFIFPASTTIAANSSVLLVSFDPTNTTALSNFLAVYSLSSTDLPVFGPWSGTLSNKGGRLAIEKPQPGDFPDPPSDISWIIEDELIYFDQFPFVNSPDGTGTALNRIDLMDSARDPNNWNAAQPSIRQIADFQLNTNSGPGGSIQKTPDQTNYMSGEFVTLTATPQAGYVFTGWSGDVPLADITDNPLVLLMDSNKIVNASFRIPSEATDVKNSWILY